MKIVLNFLIISLILGCSSPEVKEYSFNVHNTDRILKIKLPIELEDFKESIHKSDCKSCGFHQTIFSNQDFLEKIEDTTGYYIPWLSDSTANWILILKVQLHKDPSITEYQNVIKPNLKSIKDAVINENSNSKIIEENSSKNKILLSYERPKSKISPKVKRIEGRFFEDDLSIIINYYQYSDFETNIYDIVWRGLLEMEIK